MGQTTSSQLLYDVACIGNVEAIKALWREGASLEWTDWKGRTSLMVACMDPELVGVAETLIELGANVNANCPGGQAGTPLHYAAKRGLKPSVLLLLSHGANALERNEDGQTPLDVARIEGHANIVRIIENHVCYFSGWLWEFYGPSFLETLLPQLLSRKIWAVVVPLDSKDSKKPLKMELIIYSTLQNARPRSIIALWKAKIEEPKFQETNSAFVMFDEGTRTQYKLLSDIKDDKEQLQQLYNACMGIPQVMPPRVQASTPVAASETATEAIELAMATNASIQSAAADSPVSSNACQTSKQITATEHVQTKNFVPSAPPIPEESFDEGPTYNPSFDFSEVECSNPPGEYGASEVSDTKDGESSSSCTICLEAQLEAACVPCRHLVGCMTCLKEIEAKNGVCPLCRAKIDKVLRIYGV